MSQPTEIDWLALCLASETNMIHEAPYVGWVIRNRRATGRWGTELAAVILARKQFSYFDDWTESGHTPTSHRMREIFEQALTGYPGKVMVGQPFRECAEDILATPVWRAPFGPDVLHYYSPVSMKPKGSAPFWAPTAKRLFTPSGVDQNRFVFAAGVR